MEPTEEEIEALETELREICWKEPVNGLNAIARNVKTNFTRNVPVADDDVETLAAELYQIWCGTQGDAFHTSARHVLSRPAPPGTIRLGTGLTEAQKAYASSRQTWLAEKYEAAATAMMDVPWTETTDGMETWSAVRDRLLKMAADLRAAAEPSVDPRIAVVRAEVERYRSSSPADATRAILAALDAVGGAGG